MAYDEAIIPCRPMNRGDLTDGRSTGSPSAASMADMQQKAHDEGHDYAAGSPHIRHHGLRTLVTNTLQQVAGEILDAKGSCRVLEVGAGHGTFTDPMVAIGAHVTVTEMSGPSAEGLKRRFRNNSAVTVIHDRDGSAATSGGPVDMVACISVLHHIPDYLGTVTAMISRIEHSGAFVSFQDPLWHARRSRVSMFVERGAYLSWRLTQGELQRGLSTTVRRATRGLDETEVSDMAEYHVVRDGLDEFAMKTLLQETFTEVELITYWSTQAGWAHHLGARILPPTNFGLIARGHR